MAHFVLPCGSSILYLRLPDSVTQPQGGERADPQPVRRVENVAGPKSGDGKSAAPAKTSGADASAAQTQDPGKTGKAQQTGDPCMNALPLVLGMFALMYFLVIRPQQKQEKTRREMLGALKKGDEVVTSGGMIGVIEALDERQVTLRVGLGEGLKIRFDRSAVVRVGGADDDAAAKDSAGGGSKA